MNQTFLAYTSKKLYR